MRCVAISKLRRNTNSYLVSLSQNGLQQLNDSSTPKMAAARFSNPCQHHLFFKWILFSCLFQCWTDSYRVLALPRTSQDQFLRHFRNNDKRKWILWKKAKSHENSNKLRENVHELATGITPLVKEMLFKFDHGKDGRSSYTSKYQPRTIYRTFEARTREHSSRLLRSETTVGLQQKSASKEYVFRDTIGHERLNSYAVESVPEEFKGPLWYTTIITSGFLVLVIVVALCVHAPCGCLWRRHRSEHDINCPIARSHKGMCGKCFLQTSGTDAMKYEERAHYVTVSMASNQNRHRPNSGDYSSQYTLPYNGKCSGKLTQAKTKVSSLLKGCHGNSHSFDPAADYRYKQLGNRDKRHSLQSMYDPEWTSVGAFLNKNRPSSSYHGYGSLNEYEGKFVDRFCKRSRDSLDATEVVEYALKLRPRRRQVIELQEFPLGYSKSFLNIDLESDPDVLFDPYRDQLQRKKRGRKFDRLTFSDTDLRQLSCADKIGNYDRKSDLFQVPKPRKSSLKIRTIGKKTNEKVVHFFPSDFNYDAQFVQLPSESKVEINTGEFEKRFNRLFRKTGNSKFESTDKETRRFSTSKSTGRGDVSESSRLAERMKGISNKRNKKSNIKEHAVDGDLKSPCTEEGTNSGNFVQSRDWVGSYVNYGCRSSIEDLGGYKEKLAINLGPQSCHETSCLGDLYESDQNYEVEPLAGLMSPIRRAIHKEMGVSKQKKIVRPQCVEDLSSVSSYIQPLTVSTPGVPAVDPSSSIANNIYYPQPDDTKIGKVGQSQSDLEKGVSGSFKLACYEEIQRFPEKEKKAETNSFPRTNLEFDYKNPTRKST